MSYVIETQQVLENMLRYYLQLLDAGELEMLRADIEAGIKMCESEE